MRRLDGDEVAEAVRDRVFQPLADALAGAGWNCLGAARWCVLAGVPLVLAPTACSLLAAGLAGFATLLVISAFLALPLRFAATLCAEAAAVERSAAAGTGDACWPRARGGMTVAFLVMTLSWLAAALVALVGFPDAGTGAERLCVWSVAVGFALSGTGAMLATCTWRRPPGSRRRAPGAVRVPEAGGA